MAELTAAVRVVEQIREKGFKEMIVQTDSMYVCNGITSWVSKWMSNGWKTAQGYEVKHKELWQRLYEQCKFVTIHWKHVKGHSGNPDNEAADQLASTATDENLTENKSARCTAARERIQKQLSHRLSDVTKEDMSLKSSSSQTYPGKMELHMEELLTAFQSMESQVLKIVQKSYEDQRESDAMVSKLEITRLHEKVTQVEDMLKKERKDKDKVGKELRSLSEKQKAQEKRGEQSSDFEEAQRKMKTQIQQLQEQVQKEKSVVKSQDEMLSSLRKMSESTKTDLEFQSGRLSQCNVEIQNLQEKNARLSENEMKLQEEIKELKRQINIRDDQLHQLEGGDGFQIVSHKSKINIRDDSHNKTKTDTQNESIDVVVIDECEKEVSVDETRIKVTQTSDKVDQNVNRAEIKADVLLIGTSIIKDVEPGRMFRDKHVIKHVLEQKTIEGAKKYISDLRGKYNCILLQVGSNDLENSSPEAVNMGISDVVDLLKTKQPDAKILVSGILPRWKRNAADGMNFKNKKNVLNDKMREKLGGTFCPQENFSKHMFYDGTHLNTEGTSQLVSNYKYMIGKTYNQGAFTTYADKVQQETTSTYGQRSTMNTDGNGQHRGYWSNGRRRQYNGQQRRSYMGHKTGGEKKDGSDKLQSLLKLLKDLMST